MRTKGLLVATMLLVSCYYPETVHIPTARGGTNPQTGCPGRDKDLIVTADFGSLEVRVFEYQGSFVVNLSISFSAPHSVNWQLTELRDVETGRVFTPTKVEKVWFVVKEGFLGGPEFHSLPIAAEYQFQHGSFYIYFSERLFDSNKLLLVTPSIPSGGRFHEVELNRVRRITWTTINC